VTLRRAIVGLGLSWAMLPACSLLLDLGATQCQSDADCARFSRATCDPRSHLCVASAQLGSGADGAKDGGASSTDGPQCQSAAGCTACAVGGLSGLQNACAAGGCVAFDNPTRLTRMGPDGGLRSLP
jgi:hypothetical protein